MLNSHLVHYHTGKVLPMLHEKLGSSSFQSGGVNIREKLVDQAQKESPESSKPCFPQSRLKIATALQSLLFSLKFSTYFVSHYKEDNFQVSVSLLVFRRTISMSWSVVIEDFEKESQEASIKTNTVLRIFCCH